MKKNNIEIIKTESKNKNLIYMCSVIEYIVRIRFEHRYSIVKKIGKEGLERLYKGFDVWHCHTYQATAAIFAHEYNVPYGTYDFVQRSMSDKNSIYPKQISKKFAVMIENKSINNRLSLIDAAYEIYLDKNVEAIIEGRLLPNNTEKVCKTVNY